MNRIKSGIKRCKEKIDAQIEAGAITQKTVELARQRLDMDFGEYSRLQELKSVASMDGRLTLDEAMTVYNFLGETPEHFNRQSLEVKLVLTELFEKLLRR